MPLGLLSPDHPFGSSRVMVERGRPETCGAVWGG